MSYKEFFRLSLEGYKKRKENNNLYFSDGFIPQNLIIAYYNIVEKPEFSIIIENYKYNYIYNESRVETNITLEEQLGLGEVYDYISNFDFERDKFNLFVTSMILHQKLYSKCPNSSFGGKIRTESVYLFDADIDVVDPNTALIEFNKMITQTDELFKPLEDNDIFKYIENCIKKVVDLIKLQPFSDGNKRTFRALLNLLLKRINIPPVYIEVREREKYKEALLAAMRTGDYSEIVTFYHYKICDAILNLDINKSMYFSDIPENTGRK